MRLADSVSADSALKPLGELRESLVEEHLGLVVEDLSSERDVREAMAHVAHAILAGDPRYEVRLADDLGQLVGDLRDAERLPAPDIDHAPVRLALLEGKTTRTSDI